MNGVIMNGLKDHQIQELSNHMRNTLKPICGYECLRELINKAICGYLNDNNLRIDNEKQEVTAQEKCYTCGSTDFQFQSHSHGREAWCNTCGEKQSSMEG